MYGLPKSVCVVPVISMSIEVLLLYVLFVVGERIAGQEVECGELSPKPIAIATNKMSDGGSQTDTLGDSGVCLSRSKHGHTNWQLRIYLTIKIYKMVEGLIW